MSPLWVQKMTCVNNCFLLYTGVNNCLGVTNYPETGPNPKFLWFCIAYIKPVKFFNDSGLLDIYFNFTVFIDIDSL